MVSHRGELVVDGEVGGALKAHLCVRTATAITSPVAAEEVQRRLPARSGNVQLASLAGQHEDGECDDE